MNPPILNLRRESFARNILHSKKPSNAFEEFNVLITANKNLRYQSNLKVLKIAVLLLQSNQVSVDENLVAKFDKALESIKPNDFVELQIRMLACRTITSQK
ncbi:MAG: hypothetical protein KIS76_16945, partial [Pyrinomonadaceae bacterium]|nr:hypothetical protein [Pyrinomonadaceae bacterium]